IVHVIDAVLMPTLLPNTVVDIIVDSPDHEILESAVIAAELDDDLSAEGPFTVFAPTDDAFDALPAGTLDELLMDPTGALADILLYHVAAGATFSADLMDGQTITMLSTTDVTVTINMDGVFINDAMVTVVDLEADNGVVHVIDAVLLPPTSVNDIDSDNGKWIIYPNPVSDNLTIQGVESTEQFVVFNAYGQQVMTGMFNNVNSTLDVSSLSPGVYTLNLVSRFSNSTQSFIVK
ncbi:MAG: T9SS type A sorting domain-containing protein, partial [Flavobacteriales bacterium]|nr:T9SS type A sorting domain-containing protein [Flavobacteriales bacterium]